MIPRGLLLLQRLGNGADSSVSDPLTRCVRIRLCCKVSQRCKALDSSTVQKLFTTEDAAIGVQAFLTRTTADFVGR